VAPARARGLAAFLLAGALLALVAGAGATASGRPVASSTSSWLSRSVSEPAGTVLRQDRLAQSELTWHGGPVTTSTGETVQVLISDTYGPETATPEGWGEFLAHLVHGPELVQLTAHIAPLDEVELVCGARALGCYSSDQLVSIGEALIDGTTPEEVVRHEYGHHIAFNRDNPPWRAIDWGPKYWASAANICAKVSRGEAFPGDEGAHYEQNPGEAWAETYRLMDERKNGITTASWQVVSPSFYPDEAALQAVERDVLQPWTTGHSTVYRRQFTKKGKKVWLFSLQTALDGNIVITANLPRGGLQEVALVGANRRTVLKRAFRSGSRTKRITTNVCGQRSLFLRVTQKGSFGRVSVTASTP
jgi:hypothetical protein